MTGERDAKFESGKIEPADRLCRLLQCKLLRKNEYVYHSFDILDYVLVRLPPMEGGKKRPRFSLYLSAQLMYGTVRVFGRQHDYLLADAVAFKSRVRLEIATAEEINLAHVPRPEQVNIPDAAAEAGEKQAGFDPFFGVWKDWDESDVSFKEDAWLRSPSTPEREELSQLLSPSAPSGSVKPEFGSPYTVSSIEEITIKDVPVSRKLLEVEIPGEKDIPQFDGRELEMIQEEAQGEGAMMDLLDLMPDQGSQSSQSDQVATLPTAEEPEGVLPRAEVTPKKRVTKKAGETRRKRDRQQQDEGEKGEAVTPPKTARVDPDLSMELMPVEASPRQRRHRRQLFVDANIQLSKDDLRNQLATGYTTLLEKNKTLLRHWKKNLVAGISDTESDKERPIWSVPELGHSRRFGRVQRRGSLEEESFQVAEDQVKEMEPPAPLQLEEAQ
ncbi:hypothetical protein BaRGS_00025550 [Batillaria attramentaria]|uniref:Rad21/Rec8-like protein N-terminal domain-containing protein n=1 Tax=Batillaria attramentaria TaxID=370345 RepID=A0ABD0K847_9CAEN